MWSVRVMAGSSMCDGQSRTIARRGGYPCVSGEGGGWDDPGGNTEGIIDEFENGGNKIQTGSMVWRVSVLYCYFSCWQS